MIKFLVEDEENSEEGYPEVKATITCGEDFSASEVVEAFKKAMVLEGYQEFSVEKAFKDSVAEYELDNGTIGEC